jgi:hypothetical protein
MLKMQDICEWGTNNSQVTNFKRKHEPIVLKQDADPSKQVLLFFNKNKNLVHNAFQQQSSHNTN